MEDRRPPATDYGDDSLARRPALARPHGLATGLVLRTALGVYEIYEQWLAPAEEPVTATAGSPPLPQGR